MKICIRVSKRGNAEVMGNKSSSDASKSAILFLRIDSRYKTLFILTFARARVCVCSYKKKVGQLDTEKKIFVEKMRFIQPNILSDDDTKSI